MSGGVGRVNDSQGDFVRGVCWTGIAVNNESADARPFQTVRISPIVSWEASWGLGYVGVGLGGDPWAQVRGGFDVSAWGDAGTELASFRLGSCSPSPQRHINVLEQCARCRCRPGTRRKGLLFDTAWKSALSEC
jgi:hypothetical protein